VRNLRLPGLLLAALLVPAAPAGAAVHVRSAIVYGHARVGAPTARTVALVLDLYRPARRSRARRPVVVLIHGGGYAHGNRRERGLVRIAGALAARGIVAASIDYRLVGSRPQPSRRVRPLVDALPASVFSRAESAAADDTLTAIGFLRRHARRFGVDPARVGLAGSSAGATTADDVAYSLDDHGIPAPRIRFVGDLWGGIFVDAPRFGDPTAVQLEHGEAALFCVHGAADPIVPVMVDDQLVARARAQHVRHEYHRIRGAGHGYASTGFFTRRVAGRQTAFDRLLRFASTALRRHRKAG
jgi:acetyl esterase/lipase